MEIPTFSVGFQNIHGMHYGNECRFPEINCALSNDIEILAETWGCKCDLEFTRYFLERVDPQKHTGGFIVLFKNHLGSNVKSLVWKTTYLFVVFIYMT